MTDKTKKAVLLCPTCANDQFEYPGEIDEQDIDDTTKFKCSDCGSEFTKAELLELNLEVISNHIDELKADIVKDIKKMF